jgi:hypothetical protein
VDGNASVHVFDWAAALLITGGMNTLTPSGGSQQVGMKKGNPWVATNNHFNETR